MSRDVLVLNLGLDDQFRDAMMQVKGLVRTFSHSAPNADVYVATSRSRSRIGGLLEQPTGLLHVMAHGEPQGVLQSGRRVLRQPKVYDVDDLVGWVEASGVGLPVDILLLDGCDTFTPAWRAKVTELLAPRKSVVLIGTTRSVGWDEASTYVGAFYPALLRHRFPKQPARRRAAALDAHGRAVMAYKAVLDETCPFRATTLGVAPPTVSGRS